jgi:hypothetical protein
MRNASCLFLSPDWNLRAARSGSRCVVHNKSTLTLLALAAVPAVDRASAASGGGGGKISMQDFQFTMTVGPARTLKRNGLEKRASIVAPLTNGYRLHECLLPGQNHSRRRTYLPWGQKTSEEGET